MLRHILVLSCLILTVPAAVAAPCEDGRASPRGRKTCPEPIKREPYDPNWLRASRDRPGFIDLGNGTEIRIGGRTRAEFTTRQ